MRRKPVHAAIAVAVAKHAKAVFEPTSERGAAAERQPALLGQLPWRGRMVGSGGGQGLEAICMLLPGLPEICSVGETEEVPGFIEARLLQRLFVIAARYDARSRTLPPVIECHALEYGRSPRLMRALPLDPCDAPPIFAQRRRCVEVRAFGKYRTHAVSHADRHEPVRVVVLLDRENPSVPVPEAAITVAAARERLRHAAVERQTVELLVAVIDEHHGVVGDAERAAAILVHPAAYTEPVRSDARERAFSPVPDAAGTGGGIVFVPEKTAVAGRELDKVPACDNRVACRKPFRCRKCGRSSCHCGTRAAEWVGWRAAPRCVRRRSGRDAATFRTPDRHWRHRPSA